MISCTEWPLWVWAWALYEKQACSWKLEPGPAQKGGWACPQIPPPPPTEDPRITVMPLVESLGKSSSFPLNIRRADLSGLTNSYTPEGGREGGIEPTAMELFSHGVKNTVDRIIIVSRSEVTVINLKKTNLTVIRPLNLSELIY